MLAYVGVSECKSGFEVLPHILRHVPVTISEAQWPV